MYLLDTNVLSHLVRRHPPVHLTDRLRQQDASVLFTSCVCVMELRSGAIRRDDGGALWSRIEREILSQVAILDVRTEDAIVAGDVLAHLWRRGRLIDVEDILIGATALARELTVVTNNVDHFQRIPRLRVEDWTAP